MSRSWSACVQQAAPTSLLPSCPAHASVPATSTYYHLLPPASAAAMLDCFGGDYPAVECVDSSEDREEQLSS